MRRLDPLDRRLLDDWQRDLPLVPRPFAAMGAALGIDEGEVIARLVRLSEAGFVSRVGATVAPNTLGASTLAAVAAPAWRIDEVGRRIAAEPGVNHAYLREDDWNLWFVATGPDRAFVDAALARIARATGLVVLDLPLERAFHLDLGFALDGGRPAPRGVAAPDLGALRPGDRELVAGLTRGLRLVAEPWAALAASLGRAEDEVVARVRALLAARILSRVGIIVRHRPLGWRANAMVVWRLAPEEADAAGARLARAPGVTLCYRRRPDPLRWPFTLYCMIHGRSREEALATLAEAEALAGLADRPRRILFSLRCFRQEGALVAAPGEAA